MRVVYGLPSHRDVFAVKRKDASGSNGHTDYFLLKQKKLNFRVVESNHNVALFITAAGDGHLLEPNVFQQGDRLLTTLLHPHDVREAKVVSFDVMKLIADKQGSVPNFMTSSQIDKYCANGCFYFTVSLKYAPLPPQVVVAAP